MTLFDESLTKVCDVFIYDLPKHLKTHLCTLSIVKYIYNQFSVEKIKQNMFRVS